MKTLIRFAIFLFIFIILILLSACTPSEDIIRTAIIATQSQETLVAAATQLAVLQSTPEPTVNNDPAPIQEESFIAPTQEIPPMPVFEGCYPDQVCPDQTNTSNLPEIIDMLKGESHLDNETLTVIFHLVEAPQEITINRENMEENMQEYGWTVYIDVDNDPNTGMSYMAPGIDYVLSLDHSNYFNEPPQTGLITDLLEAIVFEAAPEENMLYMIDTATLTIDSANNTISMTGTIPGINENSILYFYTMDGSKMMYLDVLS